MEVACSFLLGKSNFKMVSFEVSQKLYLNKSINPRAPTWTTSVGGRLSLSGRALFLRALLSFLMLRGVKATVDGII